MKKWKYCFAVLLLLCASAMAQQAENYDSLLAKKTGADEYGMKQYVMAFLKKGKTEMADKTRVNELLKGHLANISKLADEGKMVLAGPMMDNTGLEGIFIFNVKTVAEAEALSNTDPAVKAGLFSMEFHLWYASAALMEVVPMHKKIQKKKF